MSPGQTSTPVNYGVRSMIAPDEPAGSNPHKTRATEKYNAPAANTLGVRRQGRRGCIHEGDYPAAPPNRPWRRIADVGALLPPSGSVVSATPS